MSNVPINASIPSPADQGAVIAAIASMKKSLPFLTNLSKADRKSVAKPSAKAQTFIKEALNVAIQNPAMLPASFNVSDMQNGMQLFEYLASLQLELRQLMQEVDDTMKQVGTQAYTGARAIYASASSQFSGPSLQIAADQLGKHFGRKPKAKPTVNGNGTAAASTTTAPPVHTPPATTASTSSAASSPQAISTAQGTPAPTTPHA